MDELTREQLDRMAEVARFRAMVAWWETFPIHTADDIREVMGLPRLTPKPPDDDVKPDFVR